jgi:hypothetical protein
MSLSNRKLLPAVDTVKRDIYWLDSRINPGTLKKNREEILNKNFQTLTIAFTQ